GTVGHRPVAGPAHDGLGLRPVPTLDRDRGDVDPRGRRGRRRDDVDRHGCADPPRCRWLLRDAGPFPRGVHRIGRVVDDDRLANRTAARGGTRPDLRILSSGPTHEAARSAPPPSTFVYGRSLPTPLWTRYPASPALTDMIGGRKSLIIFHDSPSSRLAKSWPCSSRRRLRRGPPHRRPSPRGAPPSTRPDRAIPSWSGGTLSRCSSSCTQ